MRPPVRRLLAFTAALFAALAGAPELIAHSHRAGPSALVAQAGVRSTAAAPCAPTQHFDPAELDHHPACPACLTGCARHAVPAPMADFAVARGCALSHRPDAAPPRPHAVRRPPSGRGPPRG